LFSQSIYGKLILLAGWKALVVVGMSTVLTATYCQRSVQGKCAFASAMENIIFKSKLKLPSLTVNKKERALGQESTGPLAGAWIKGKKIRSIRLAVGRARRTPQKRWVFEFGMRLGLAQFRCTCSCVCMGNPQNAYLPQKWHHGYSVSSYYSCDPFTISQGLMKMASSGCSS